MYNDPDIGIKWPITPETELIMSEKDHKWGGIKQLRESMKKSAEIGKNGQ